MYKQILEKMLCAHFSEFIHGKVQSDDWEDYLACEKCLPGFNLDCKIYCLVTIVYEGKKLLYNFNMIWVQWLTVLLNAST